MLQNSTRPKCPKMPRKKVEARPITHNGKECWRVIIPKELNCGKQKRRYFDDKTDAENFAADQEAERRSAHARFLVLDSNIQNAVLHALGLLEGREIEIADAVQFYLRSNTKEQRTLGDAIADCLAAKKASGCRHRYLVALANTLKRFSLGKENLFANEITVREVDAWINAEGISNATRRSRHIDLGTFFSFCVKRGYCTANPTSALERQKFDDKAPGIFTPQECDTILFWCADQHPDMLAVLALQMFAGLRPYEAYKMSWADLTGGEIIMSGKHTKTRSRRIVPINETLDAWLQYAWERGAQLPPKDGPRKMTPVRAPVIKWHQDGLRHSFVSYFYELHGEVQTAKIAGHSEEMLHRHYRSLVTRQSAEEFWGLRPDAISKLPEFVK